MVRKATWGIALILAFGVTPALAGPWSAPSGTAGDFTYSNGGDNNGLFGDPFIFGNQFVFSTAFSVLASGGATDDKSDVVSFDAVADAGLFFSGVTVSAIGSYAISGDGSVDVDAEISMQENGGLGRTFSDSLLTSPAFPRTAGQGTWNGNAAVSVTTVFPTPHNDIHFELSTDMMAISGPGGSAQLNVQFESLQIDFIVIPEPASLSMVAVAGLLMIRRRRRR
ncbi:MAG: PEP-CTERM sorting domain-containing protein [Phycisphaerales bacterium]|nr:PEP-CTERM sorting domain-containing protein [Phycisphaerales bacterium]